MFGSLILNGVLSHEKLTEMLVSAENATDTTTYIPGDRELMSAFQNAWLVNLQTRGVLYLLESRIHPTMSATTLFGFDGYSLEHLMPKKWRNNWPKCANEEDARKRDVTLLTMGNLAIIPQVLNASIRDAQWSVKLSGKGEKAGLRVCATGLYTMQNVLASEVWDEQAILARANWLFEQAKVIWAVNGLPVVTPVPPLPIPGYELNDVHPADPVTAYDVKNERYVTVHIVGKKLIAERGGHAEGYKTDICLSSIQGVPAFFVLKGSTVALNPTPSCQMHILNLRQHCYGVLTGNVINRDLLFTSATAAANFICYGSASGNEMWK